MIDCCKLALGDFLPLNDVKLLEFLHEFSPGTTANGYSKGIEALFMKPTDFLRAGIDNYATNFSNVLIRNPNYKNSSPGRASKEIINEMFMAALHSEQF